MFIGNRNQIQQDADEIVRRLKAGEVTLGALMAEYHVAYATLMQEIRQRLTKRQWAAIRLRRRKQVGKATGFQKGHVTWNAGKKGWCAPGCKATWFQAGGIRGRAARLYCEIGTIQIRYAKPPKRMRGRANGRKGKPSRWIKVRDDGRPQDRWIPYARYVWEKEHGRPVPKGFFVVHANGDTMDDAPVNLIVVDQKENMRRLYENRPDAIALCRKIAGKRTRERHAAARKLQASVGKMLVSYDCGGCGESYAQVPERCGKCGATAFERIERQELMPDSEREAVLVRVTESELMTG